MKRAIFLSGPIGAGKTTLGKALADRLSAGFIDGDDYSDHSRPWYCSILQTSRAIVHQGFANLETRSDVVIAYPLGCVNWIYYRRKFGDSGIQPIFVSLRASYEAIVSPSRGRAFDTNEHTRIKEMISEGYASRTFSDLVIDTDQAEFDETVSTLERNISIKCHKR